MQVCRNGKTSLFSETCRDDYALIRLRYTSDANCVSMAVRRRPSLVPVTMPTVTTLEALTQDPKNARRRTQRSTAMIERSLQEFGAARSLVIDEAGRILAGNGTAEAAAAIGIEKVLVVPSDGRTLIAVQRTDLTEAQKAEYGVADNRASDLSEFDGAALAGLLEEHPSLDLGPWFTDDEFKALVDGIDPEPPPQEPEAPEPGAGLTVQLTFPDQQAMTDFQTLMGRLAAAMPEEESTEARLTRAVEALLAQRGR
jgi:hypothetical protein